MLINFLDRTLFQFSMKLPMLSLSFPMELTVSEHGMLFSTRVAKATGSLPSRKKTAWPLCDFMMKDIFKTVHFSVLNIFSRVIRPVRSGGLSTYPS